jgi:hypothetical protein
MPSSEDTIEFEPKKNFIRRPQPSTVLDPYWILKMKSVHRPTGSTIRIDGKSLR